MGCGCLKGRELSLWRLVGGCSRFPEAFLGLVAAGLLGQQLSVSEIGVIYYHVKKNVYRLKKVEKNRIARKIEKG